MAFSQIMQKLIPQGATVRGATPNVIRQDGSIVPENTIDDSVSGRLLEAIEGRRLKIKKQLEDQQKKHEKQLDMYKTLRDSGYDPKTAYEAVLKNELPEEAGGKTSAEKKAEATVEKTKAETAKIKKETEGISTSKKKLIDDITIKVARDEKLTPGEQKIYNDVIKKGGQSDLDVILDRNKRLNEQIEGENVADLIPMLNPQGKKKKVHPDDVSRALKKGWTLRR